MNILKPAEVTIVTIPTVIIKPDIIASRGNCDGCNCGVLLPGTIVSNPVLR